MKKKATNSNEPATQHDLELLGGHLSSRIDEVEGAVEEVKDEIVGVKDEIVGVKGEIVGVKVRLDNAEEEMAIHRKILEAILSVVKSIDARAKETKDHPIILKNHEKRISDTEVQIRMMRR
ncbi:MAG: hypothetical protein O3A36_01025 [bacterium]|nr:hypothetical protein [bacterium]